MDKAIPAFLFLWSLTVASTGCGSPTPVLRMATLNLAHGRGIKSSQFGLTKEEVVAHLDAIADVVRWEGPHVLALQEADAPSFWSGHFDHVGYLARSVPFLFHYHGIHLDADLLNVQLGYGTALMAQQPLVATASYAFTANWYHAKGFTTAEIEFHKSPLLVASIHLDSLSTDIRRKQGEQIIDTVEEYVSQDKRSPTRKKPERSVILMGDFNSRWDQPNDALRLIASRLNLQAYQPESGELPTFRSYKPRTRLDWILISPDLEFTDYQVWPDQVSDHLGVAAQIRRRK